MQELLPRAARIGELLKQRQETISVAESSTGGLISAALLSVAGASAYFLGGAVSYTRKSMRETVGVSDDGFAQMKGLTEASALVMARAQQARLGTTWAIAELGAAGPTGSRYGNPAGTTAIAVVGPVEKASVIQTGSADRIANMRAFADAALGLLERAIGAKD